MRRRAARLLPGRTLVVAAAALTVAATGLGPPLVQDRERALAGELWRLLTGHLVHIGSYHLLWNVAGLIGAGLLFERFLGRRFWVVLAGSATAVGAGLLALDPALGTYAGLSGVLNGLWLAGALTAARRGTAAGFAGLARFYRAAAVANVLKIGLEAAMGPVFTDPTALGGHPVPLAHALGALGGLTTNVVAGRRSRFLPVPAKADARRVRTAVRAPRGWFAEGAS